MTVPRETMLFVGGVLDGRWEEVQPGMLEYTAPKAGRDGFINRDVYVLSRLEQYTGKEPNLVRHYVHFWRLRGTLETDALRRLMEFYRPEKPT